MTSIYSCTDILPLRRSPSPYDALCQGVPFLNPILEHDDRNPEDRTQWQTQHNGVKHLDPPYVYNVYAHDTEGFVEAIGSALATPIGSTIVARMRQDEVDKRVQAILSANFKGHARWVYWGCRATFWRKDRKVRYVGSPILQTAECSSFRSSVTRFDD